MLVLPRQIDQQAPAPPERGRKRAVDWSGFATALDNAAIQRPVPSPAAALDRSPGLQIHRTSTIASVTASSAPRGMSAEAAASGRALDDQRLARAGLARRTFIRRLVSPEESRSWSPWYAT
jgi:hypothetical protein